MKVILLKQKSMPKTEKISKEEIEKTKIGCASSQYYFWLQYSHWDTFLISVQLQAILQKCKIKVKNERLKYGKLLFFSVW